MLEDGQEKVITEGSEGSSDGESLEEKDNAGLGEEGSEEKTEKEAGAEDSDKDKEEADSDKEEDKDKDKEKEGEEELFGKPEAYDYKEVKLPEGMQLDTETTTEFNQLATELNLSQKSADKLMNLAVKQTQKVQEQVQTLIAQGQQAKKEGYKLALNQDKEIGGAKLAEAKKTANIAYEKFASEEFKDLMAETGLNFHPAVIKMFRSIGKQMESDVIDDAKVPHGTEKSAAQILYGNSTSNED